MGEAHRHAEFVAQARGERDVLVRKPEREARRVILSGQEEGRDVIEGATAAYGALPDRLEESVRLHARAHAHREGLRETSLDDVAREVVDQLGDEPGADRADIGRLIADRVEHLLVCVEHLLVASEPDRELAGVSADRAATDGRVHHVDPLLREDHVEAAHQRRRVRTQVEPGGAGAHACQQAIIPKSDRLDLDRAWERGKDDVHLLGDLPWRVCPESACGQMRLGRLASHVMDDDDFAVPKVHEVAGHVSAHRAQSDESGFHQSLVPLLIPCAS